MKTFKQSDFFVFGYFGYLTNQLDGQTVKTRSVHQLLEEKVNIQIPFYDTEKIKSNKLSLIPALLQLVQSKHVIYLPAQNNLKSFFPFLFILSKIFNFKIHYFVVGGWLFNFLQNNQSLVQKLKGIHKIYPETNRLCQQLSEKYEINNTCVFPNFRFFEPDEPKLAIAQESNHSLKLVFFSRINKLKGINTIFDILPRLKFPVEVDFFGPIHPSEEDDFLKRISRSKNARYRGILQPSEVYQVLMQYDVLLFPTQYYTEGLPGAIVDAYISGIPVIATEWVHAHEFIQHGKTGFLIPFTNCEDQLIVFLEQINSDRDLLTQLKVNAFKEANKYSSDYAWNILKASLNLEF
jgi:glycosyltransferase involved in cell wall biosynthesis